MNCLRFFLLNNDNCIARVDFELGTYLPVPHIGETVYLDEMLFKDAEERAGTKLDFDFYKVQDVNYDYSGGTCAIEVFVVGWYFYHEPDEE